MPAFSLLATLLSIPAVSFHVQPRDVQRGGSVTVAWNAGDARAVWLSGRGRVANAGTWTFAPQETTTIVLAVERGREPAFFTDTVIVRGSRGDEDAYVLPDERMPFARNAHSKRSLVETVEAASRELNSTLSLPNRPLVVDGAYVFVTRKAPLRVKGTPPRRGVREWRVGWRVKVVPSPPPFNATTVEIACRAEYRLRGKEKWLLESDAALYDQEILPLANRMLHALR